MFYVFKIAKINNNKSIYYLFGTHSESVFKTDERFLIKLVKEKGIEIKNISIKNDRVELNRWPHSIESNLGDKESNYVLIGNIEKSQFKMIDSTGKVGYYDEAELKTLIESDRVLNCEYTNNTNKIYKSTDTYSIRKDPKIIEQIYAKYIDFRMQGLHLGMDLGFDYIIENEEVKITKYTGTSDKVVIPNFITAVLANAYSYRGIRELMINEGLKFIGNSAFKGNDITFVLLPYSVEIVGKEAFDRDIRGTHKNIYKKLNPNTLMIH